MPIIKNSVAQQSSSSSSSSSSSYGEFKDISKTIWKNTVTMRENNEFAVFDFLTPLDQGDGSYFHPVPSKNPRTGNSFTQQVYCNEKNISLDGRVVEADCIPCHDGISVDQRTTYPRMRYTYWVLHYGTYHLETNADLQDQKPWTQDWKQATLGKQTFFRESVLKPQLLVLSQRTWDSVQAIDTRKGTILSTSEVPSHFEFRRSFASSAGSRGMVSYDILASDISVPDLSEEAAKIVADLPKLDQIAAGSITELDLPQFGSPSVVKEQKDTADAFERIANIKEDGEF